MKRPVASARRNRLRWRWVALLAAASVIAATLDASSSASLSGTPSLRGKTVFVLSCPDSNTWCAAYNKTARRIGQAAGLKVVVLVDNFDPALQAQHMDQAIAQKPAAILAVPVDSHAIVVSMRKAWQAKVPVINGIHRIAKDGYRYIVHSVEANTCALGTAAAQNIIDGLRAIGRKTANVIAITGAASQFTVQDRMACFKRTLAKVKGYKLVAVEDGNWEDQKSGDLARQLFAKFQPRGGIHAAYGMADNQTNAIIQAALQAGLPVGVKNKGLIAVGTACQPVTIKNVRAGLQYGSATNSPLTESVPNMTTVVKFLRGVKMPKIIRVKESRITQKNLNRFLKECNF
jgi:ABC-type sugar transport system substrate-binding protein